MMQEKATTEPVKQVSLRQLAGRNSILSLLLFIVLVGIIFAAAMKDRASMNGLASTYEDQFRVERFKASLTNIMLPINDFTMTGDTKNFDKIKQAVSAYKASFDTVKSISYLTEQDQKLLQQVDQLMLEVMKTANDVANEKITVGQAAQVTVLAQNLVLAAQMKLEGIVKDLEAQLQASAMERQKKSTMYLYILSGFIVFILLLLEFLSRRLVKHAQVVSRVSSSVAESAGDIIEVNKLQANTTDQQARFMKKVTQGLELIAASGSQISETAGSLEKNMAVLTSFAKGGKGEVESATVSMASLQENTVDLTQQLATNKLKSERVLQSLDLIQEVAEEAHLLALNASIDGVGQGSSTMTNEVQRMSDKIRDFTVEIRSSVEEIIASNGAVGTAVASSQAELEKNLEIAHRLIDVFNRVEKISLDNTQSVAGLAKATIRQKERNQKLLQALNHISELLLISGNKMEAYGDASARLNEASESLQSLS